MERTVLVAASFWMTGVAGWAVGAGYMLAPRVFGGRAPPYERLERCASPSMEADGAPAPAEAAPGEEGLLRPDDASDIMTESERRRLAPIGQLKRKRRSRKVRVIGAGAGEKFVPLVAGARQSVDESIMASYTETSGFSKREQGEDYWVDPVLLQEQSSAEERRKLAEESRRKQMTRVEPRFTEDRLRKEIVAPYKARRAAPPPRARAYAAPARPSHPRPFARRQSNAIGIVTVAIGVIAVIFSLFPELLDSNVATSIASFPSEL